MNFGVWFVLIRENRSCSRQNDAKSAASTISITVSPDAAAMRFDNCSSDRQPKPSTPGLSSTCRVSPVETVKDMGQVIRSGSQLLCQQPLGSAFLGFHQGSEFTFPPSGVKRMELFSKFCRHWVRRLQSPWMVGMLPEISF